MGLLGLFVSSGDVIGRLTSSNKEEEKANDLLEQSKWVYLGVFIGEDRFLTLLSCVG